MAAAAQQAAPRKRAPGGGRKPGTRNTATIEREVTLAARAQSVQEVIAAGVTPLELLLRRMRGQALPDGREITDKMHKAAVDAAPYCHPRLAAVTVRDETPPPPMFDFSRLSHEQARALLELMSMARVSTTIEGQRA